MSSTASRVRDVINSIGDGVIFTMLHLLDCGGTNAIYIELCRQVARGSIKRLTNGAFIKSYADDVEPPSAFDLASAKAARFGKRIIRQQSADGTAELNSFYTDSCKGVFKSTIHGNIKFKHLHPRKMKRMLWDRMEKLQAKIKERTDRAENSSGQENVQEANLEHSVITELFQMLKAVLTRFENPQIKHRLTRSSKLSLSY